MAHISDPVYIPLWLAIISILSQIVQLAGQLVGIAISFFNNSKIKETHTEVKEARKEINGQTKALLLVTAEAKFAEGVKSEVDRQIAKNGG